MHSDTASRSAAAIRDVTLRDGLQLTGALLSTARKVELIRALLALGVPELEIGSMARPDLVPPLANTLDVIAELSPSELDRCWVWVATPGHVKRAGQAGAIRFQYCLSASESHNRANIGRDVETSMDAFPEAAQAARDFKGLIQLAIATAFTCPFEGPTAVDRVLDLTCDPRIAAASDVVLCDTLGQAVPNEVTQLFHAVRTRDPERSVAFHGHDTWGLGVANSIAALDAGARFVDATLGGLGGCRFAPGASGNVALEDLVFALRPDWLTPERFRSMVSLSNGLLTDLDEPVRSQASRAAMSTPRGFDWAVADSQRPE